MLIFTAMGGVGDTGGIFGAKVFTANQKNLGYILLNILQQNCDYRS